HRMAVTEEAGRVARVAPRADAVAAPPPKPAAPSRLPAIDANALAERWDDIVARVRSQGRALLAAALAETTPVAVSAQGVVTLQLDAPDEIKSQALESGRNDALEAIRASFSGVERVVVRVVASSAPAPAPKRITDESVRADRVTALRKKDPILGAAVDALDLDLIE
ncbi:MAG TPA: hypothetical protein VHM30_17380, partial [Gemmatimonadaceae bacterium]|nr:hypothetical protein [Gemmatimonadaceae bacterium]